VCRPKPPSTRFYAVRRYPDEELEPPLSTMDDPPPLRVATADLVPQDAISSSSPLSIRICRCLSGL